MRKLILVGTMAMLTITTACGEETINEAKNEQANVNSVVQEETANGNEAEETSNSTNASDIEKVEKTILFANGDEAIDYLRKELDMENNEGIIFDDMGGLLESDSYGSYYEIVLKSKEWIAAGGSGTAGIYKVYQDGKYELAYGYADKQHIIFSSVSEAIDYLRKELDMENNEDIYFEVLDRFLEKDSYGIYYKIALYSKEIKAAGGSGTVGVYKVYQDGKYELI